MTLALTVRGTLVVVNVAAIVVIVAILAYRVISVRREPKERPAQNLTPFFDDEVLEGRHLERVLRWALLFSVILAVGLPLYWLLEPSRQDAEAKGFDQRAIERGRVLFSNKQMPDYDPTKSLLCADCHGTDAGGGSANFVLTPDAQGNPKATPVQVSWQAPALNTVMYRFNDCTTEDLNAKAKNCTRAEQQVTQIITYGRPGTPMAAWGVEGGGPKNDQSVSDIVAYLKSIQLSSAKARQQVQDNVQKLKDAALGNPKAGIKSWPDTAEANLADAQTAYDAAVAAAANVPKGGDPKSYQQAVVVAKGKLDAAKAAVPISQQASDAIKNASPGQLLFETNCARCHTKQWSFYDPTNSQIPPLPPQGSGAFGPDLTHGATLNQFPGDPGLAKQIDWVTNGAEAFKPYGVRGISSGRMPHFGAILSKKQIQQIVDYERSL